MSLSEDLARNRKLWSGDEDYLVASGRDAWAQAEITWGIWSLRESELGVLADEVAGRDVIELGCGTAYVSAWLARRGARPTGIDPTPAQLERARALQRKFELEFPLIEASARTTSRSPMRRSTWPYRSTGPASGPIHTAGCRKPLACCGRAAVSSSCATRRL
jgi:SAM-dependent methyltransferase